MNEYLKAQTRGRDTAVVVTLPLEFDLDCRCLTLGRMSRLPRSQRSTEVEQGNRFTHVALQSCSRPEKVGPRQTLIP